MFRREMSQKDRGAGEEKTMTLIVARTVSQFSKHIFHFRRMSGLQSPSERNVDHRKQTPSNLNHSLGLARSRALAKWKNGASIAFHSPVFRKIVTFWRTVHNNLLQRPKNIERVDEILYH